MGTELLDGLNEQQREAVAAGEGPVLVLAGPGSGKTRVLTHRIAYLIQDMGIPADAIMAVTFTNKAAGEMRTRVENLLRGRLKGLQIGTFHAICARLLRREAEHTPYRHDYLIYDTDDQVSVITQAMNELNVDTKKYTPRSILNLISSAKNELITPDTFVGRDYFGEIAARVYPVYQENLIAANAMDFDDLLMQTTLLFRNNHQVREKYQRFYQYVLVDEFQDTNMAQYELVRLVSKPQNNVFVVGDEDQGIYAFRGADFRNVQRFRQDYPEAKVILLEQNYRSTQIVLDAARAVIDKNTQRTPKALFTDRAGGPLVTVYEAYNEEEEAGFVVRKILDTRRKFKLDYKDFAIMYRTNAQSRALEDACVREGIPYRLVGGVGFYRRREIRDLLAYMRLVNNPDDVVSFTRVINAPKRGIGKKTVADFQEWAGKQRIGIGAALEKLVNGEASTLPVSTARKFAEFGQMLQEWRELAGMGNLLTLLDDMTSKLQYNTVYIHEISDNEEQANERRENIRELRGILDSKKELPLDEFLTDIALVSDVDTLAEDMNTVTLLTLHAAKGLEYPVVFITGLEDGLLPHFRSKDDIDALAEERRLLYVGLTRAKDQLYLTYAFRRFLYGSSGGASEPSPFLYDIPTDLTEGNISPQNSQLRDRESYRRSVTWDIPKNVTPPQPLTPSQSAMRGKITPFGQSAPKPLNYPTGVKVYHAKFGEGIVIESKRMGEDEEVTVSFKNVGIKRLAASFANLVVVKE
jgi:DNA helicase II / ATP-dependent DNA helicase PcrA